MLLYSTMLNMRDTMTKENFVNAVIEWNQQNPREENRIPDLCWKGERWKRFGTEKLWLEIQEYSNRNIMAVRYSKITDADIIWNTDYVMNFEQHRMSIQLDRSYNGEPLEMNEIFSTPLFISTLIEHDFIENDGDLAITKRPIMIHSENLDFFERAISGKTGHKLPIIYVSKTRENVDPINTVLLASRLKGAAHVMVQEDRVSNRSIKKICKENTVNNGSIGIYYPGGTQVCKGIPYRAVKDMENILFNKIINLVLGYANLQSMETLYTWQGVNNALLNDKLIHQKKKRQNAEQETEEVYEAFDDELKSLKNKIGELLKNNEILMAENARMSQRLAYNSDTGKPLIYMGDEQEVFPGEIKDLILSSLSEVLKGCPESGRMFHILTDIIENNNYEHLIEERKSKIKSILKGYKTFSPRMETEFEGLGFEVSHDGTHIKLVYNGDSRYIVVASKTNSDYRGGQNIVSNINNIIF